MIYKELFDKNSFEVKFRIEDNGHNPCNSSIFLSDEIKIDTGADLTVFPARDLFPEDITVSKFTDWLQNNDKVIGIKSGHYNKRCLFGFSNKGVNKNADAIMSYAYQVEKFTLVLEDGELELGSVPITISFNEGFQRPLLGKDLLSLINFKIDNDMHFLEFEETEKLISIKQE
ncbi:MAG: hypothetical protein IJ733_11010 [Lachnospiraceae bacterium]|nr:hypothetical protein [Lachnospiraceae bacterium]